MVAHQFRTEKQKHLKTQATILEVLGRTEEDIKDGLTINEVLPFFEKYKLKLRVYDVFYNLIHRYDPQVPNFNHRPILLRHRRGGPHLHPEQGPGQPDSEVGGRRLQGVRRD